MVTIRHNRGLPIELINHSDLLDMPDLAGTVGDHDARYYTEAELGSIIAPSGASLIGVSDAGAFFAGADVEAVLQEIMAVILPADYLRLDGTNVPTANYNWVTNLTTAGTIQGGTLTDGFATLTGGAWTGATYNGLTITTGVNTFTLTSGTTDLIVNVDCTIDQDLSSTSSPTFNALIVTTINGLTGIGCAANVISITCGTTDLTVSADCAINQNLSVLSNVDFASVGLFDFVDEYYLNLRAALGKLGAADKSLTIDVNDANRTLTFTGNATLNQDVSTTGSPTFNALTVTSLNGLTGIGCVANVISITCGTTDLTVSADCAINQNLNTVATPTFRGLTLFEPVNSDTITIVPRANALITADVLTIDTWGTDPTFYIQGPNLCAIDQDVRVGAGPSFVNITISNLITGGDLLLIGVSQDGSPVMDVTGAGGADGFGVAADDGQGVIITTGDGGTGFGGVGGDGGNYIIILGTGSPGTVVGVDGIFTIGDGVTNYTRIGATGDMSFVGSAGFYPRLVRQDAEPANGVGATQIDDEEMIFWIDTNDGNRVWFMYNDNTNANIVKVELT